jgi:hypothetical protein
MQAKHAAISYLYQSTPDGGRVLMRTRDPQALEAIHQFLKFQIEEHRTGDPTTFSTSKRSTGNEAGLKE